MAPPIPLPGALFPILSAEDVILGCQAIELHLSEADLRQPSSLLVEKIWDRWSDRLLGYTSETSNRVALDQLDKMDYPEIYESAMKSRMFFRMVQQLTDAAQIERFSLSDVANPQSGRLIDALSGIINFWYFEEEQAEDILQPLIEEQKIMREQEIELETRSNELRLKIEQERWVTRLLLCSMERLRTDLAGLRYRRAKRLENEPKVTQAKLEIARRQQDLQAQQREGHRLEAQMKEKKAAVIGLANHLMELSKEQTRLHSKVNRLQSQIVRSPERLRQSVVSLREDLDRVVGELRATEAKAHQLSGKISSLQKYKADLESCNTIARDLASDVAKMLDGQQRLAKLEEEWSKAEAAREGYEETSRNSERRLEFLRDNCSKFDEKTQYKREAGKTKKKRLEEEWSNLKQERVDFDMRTAEVNRRAVEIEATVSRRRPDKRLAKTENITHRPSSCLQIKSIHNETYAVLDKSEALYREMVDSVGLYSLQVNKAIDAMHTACATRMVL
ncbi:BZ3500_MvSof-1268-A1-R1_Chr3-1g05811 [Microbotryum saponariae]|uniref:BZ3500_MvSof-1268-A1-R1_Chr3-1g05811 protein n=1 Tax=Microbotryum saponariae TaxID=289078 RepID=A0A2X0LDQ4_9BASI|nr:BZ3500_MvSof-1268-A1-R1_Chr3-1g05811 [Microbotryum saponariae]SDA05001.1 BZ3501_MvSof-1269-A2-R1_Chr3-1g05481 [Microbotryum saponariae]